MKRKNVFWILLALATCFVGTPAIAHAAQQKDVPPQPPQAAQPASPQPNPSDKRDAQQTITGPYRITYTLTEMDGTRRVGSQRYAIVLDSGEESPSAELKLGSKVPLETGEFKAGSGAQTEISYIDVGLMIQANLRSFANGHELRSHIVQSEIDSHESITKDPVVRQTEFKSAILLQENKPVIIGNVDMLGTTHVLQIQVELSKLP